jgi:hypothetical protein
MKNYLLILCSCLLQCLTGNYSHLHHRSETSVAEHGVTPTGHKYLLITDQSQNRILIADAEAGKITWEWKPENDGVQAKEAKWFSAPSDVKPVYNGKYLLIVASGGGVALVRISDKKTVFYAYAGGNTHSAEVLPDGNIVTASSTANYLMIFNTDTLHFRDSLYQKKIYLPFAHNVVWDQKRQVLWSAGRNKLYRYKYNFNCHKPDLILADSIILPDTDAHDLYPVFGKDQLWLTTPRGVFNVNPSTNKVMAVEASSIKDIKNVSSGPAGYATIMMQPKTSWWTDEVKDDQGKTIFKQDGLKIYKARWLLTDTFSYTPLSVIKICR